MESQEKLKWKDNKLYKGRKLVVELIPEDFTITNYRLRFPDGELSSSNYNLTRARDHAISAALGEV